MKIRKIARGMVGLAAVACVSALGSAQRVGTPGGGGGGNLANDIRERPIPETSFDANRIEEGLPRRAGAVGSLENDVVVSHDPTLGGPVLDGGTIYVDVGQDAGLEISVEVTAIQGPDPFGIRPGAQKKTSVRLAGGKPGDAGVILFSSSSSAAHAGAGKAGHVRAADLAKIAGFFGKDGSFVVELPELPDADAGHGIYARGLDLASKTWSGVVNLGEESSAPEVLTSFEAEAISNAVRGVTRNEEEGGVRLRFYGLATIGELQRAADLTVVLRAEPDGFSLLRLADGAVFSFRTVEQASAAVKAMMILEAFSSFEQEIEGARLQSAGRRARISSIKDSLSRAAEPTRWVERTLEGEETAEVGVEIGGSASIGEKPHGIQPPASSAPEAPAHGTYDDPIRDGGSIDVGLSPDQPVENAWSAARLDGQPRRAEKSPESTSKGAVYSGPIEDADSRTVVLEDEAEAAGHARRALEGLDLVERTLEILRQRLVRCSL